MEIGVKQANVALSKLIERVRAGESVIITNHGEPVARLVTARRATNRTRGYGCFREQLATLPEDWGSPAEKAKTNKLILGAD